MAHALRHFKPQVARDQHGRLVGLEIVKVGPFLPADLEQVAKPSVVIRPVRPPRCWIRALVPTVVP